LDARSGIPGTRYGVRVRDVMNTEVVIDAHRMLVGIVTEADLIAKEAYPGDGPARGLK
jgi:CBS-domain-containing membrane protein